MPCIDFFGALAAGSCGLHGQTLRSLHPEASMATDIINQLHEQLEPPITLVNTLAPISSFVGVGRIHGTVMLPAALNHDNGCRSL